MAGLLQWGVVGISEGLSYHLPGLTSEFTAVEFFGLWSQMTSQSRQPFLFGELPYSENGVFDILQPADYLLAGEHR